ncbi:MAG: alpha-glucan family phosphorylase [Planctomycetes bacterium]|nr:alpha-glucan family phosphorylase [Planctomycetota bacterium]
MAQYLRDPVCGMPVVRDAPIRLEYGGREFLFCSEYCRTAFRKAPEAYASMATRTIGSRRSAAAPWIAYFSMEVALAPKIPTYAGGLGILAGDMLKSFADLEAPVVAVSLLHRAGYFEQELDEGGNQHERPSVWSPETLLRPLEARVRVQIEGRDVVLRAWRYDVAGATGFSVPVILLDAGVPENRPEDRALTSTLYGGDARHRLAQEIVLGIGGVRVLRALGYANVRRFHMNEGHAGLLALELLREKGGDPADLSGVRERCVFTTHTPVAAGHDQFDYELVHRVLGDLLPRDALEMLAGRSTLNMTLLALNLSGFVNGVAKRHGIVSQDMFPGYPIHSITNGVHSATWTCPSFAALYDRHIPGWSSDPFSLRHAISIPHHEIWDAHMAAKAGLLEEVRRRTGVELSRDALTIGCARRATAYKRADLILGDVAELAGVAQAWPLQILFAGKAHPQDEPGKEIIRRITRRAGELRGVVPIVYLENYDMELAGLLTAGADLWLNTPQPPMEASGTSGMKAAHNGVPSLSVLDGWWVEGHIEGITGWAIGRGQPAESSEDHARELYEKLRSRIAPMFFRDRDRWIEIMRFSISLNAAYFNTHRVVQQYLAMAYS